MPRLLRSAVLVSALSSLLLSSAVFARDGKLPEALAEKWERARADESLPYDVKTWVTQVIRKNYEDAAHQWAVIQPQIPGPYQNLAQSTWLFFLYKLDLPQTFVDNYLKALLDKNFVASEPAKILTNELGAQFEELVSEHVVFFTPEQLTLVPKLPASGLGLDLQAWSLLRKGEKAGAVATKLPENSRLRFLLERTYALSLVKKGKVEKALELYEGIIKRSTDNDEETQREAASEAWLQIGRLQYQLADLKAAEAAYEKVHEKSSSYVASREELMWIWLRNGDTTKLRGTLQSFAASSLENHLMPEFYVVRAISNLKLCQFDAAKKDFEGFVAYNSAGSKKIDEALKASDPASPPDQDWYTAMVVKAQSQLQDEIKVLDEYKKKSITASLPTVGEQKHWKEASASLSQRVIMLGKLKTAEFHRQWRNHSVAMREAIRKMQFVKVELLSQLESGKTAQPESATTLASHDKNKGEISEEANGRLSFKFDGVMWSDELFKLRSTAPNACL